MIVNRRRGEIAADLGGTPRLMCLTLGALAHLEDELQVKDLAELAARFSSGSLSASELLSIIHAGLVGGGNTLTREDVADMQAEGGVAGYVKIAADLLAATFGTGDGK